MKIVNQIISIWVSVVLPGIIIVGCTYINLTNPKFFIAYNESGSQNSFEEMLDLNQDIVYSAINNMLEFVNGDIENPQILFEINDKEEQFFNERELTHLCDLRQIISRMKRILSGLLISGVIGIAVLWKQKEMKLLAKSFIAVQSIEMLGIICIAILYAYKPIMIITWGHRQFFDDTSWIFNPAIDRIIYFFPDAIYARMILIFSMIWISITGILLFVSLRVLKKN